jgi:beta-glucosidase
MLSGKDKTATLAYNKDILEELLDYDSDVWDFVLAELTKDDIKNLIGKGGFQTQSLYSIGKPQCLDKDGPAGYNNNVTNPGKSAEYTLFPSEALTGCSWNPSVTYKIGVAQGKIGNASGVNGWYAPGVNLHRSVYNSRNYEYYSEDALLSGTLAEQTIAGAYDNNVYCYLKHFAVSEAGQNPTNVNTWLTEQALRESYLKSFEIAVKGGKATAVMSAFNRVGAVLAGYNHALLTDVLRNEWNFRGSVITDWFSGSGYMSSHTLGVLAGNDLWLCGTADVAANLDFDDPAVAYAAHISAKNILYTYVKTNAHAEELNVNQTPHSTLFSVLWIVLNVVLGIGIAVCLLFTFLPSKKKVTPDQSTEQNSHNQS